MCQSLVQVETHDGIRKIGKNAFFGCKSLPRINLKSVVEIEQLAFFACDSLESVEFGDRLETIGGGAFVNCESLSHLKLPSIVTIERRAFSGCKRLIDIEFSERLETIGVQAFAAQAFAACDNLQRIAIPLKRDLFSFDDDDDDDGSQRINQFGGCRQLTTVDLVGGIHGTVASLHMDSWRTEMIAEINRINQVLFNASRHHKAEEIQQWIESAVDKLDHYKAEHYRYVEEGITLLELALWKAKLGEKEDSVVEGQAKKAIDSETTRSEGRITCGADLVIKNVLPFLELE